MRRLGPPCGCLRGGPDHECGVNKPIPATPRHIAASRQAWLHLAFCGLVDSDGLVAEVLRPKGSAT